MLISKKNMQFFEAPTLAFALAYSLRAHFHLYSYLHSKKLTSRRTWRETATTPSTCSAWTPSSAPSLCVWSRATTSRSSSSTSFAWVAWAWRSSGPTSSRRAGSGSSWLRPTTRSRSSSPSRCFSRWGDYFNFSRNKLILGAHNIFSRLRIIFFSTHYFSKRTTLF